MGANESPESHIKTSNGSHLEFQDGHHGKPTFNSISETKAITEFISTDMPICLWSTCNNLPIDGSNYALPILTAILNFKMAAI